MSIDNQNNLKFVPKALLLLSLLLAGAAAGKYVIFQIDKNAIPQRIDNTVSSADPNEDTIKKMQAKYNEAASKLKKKNLLDPPPPKKKNPISQVMAIMGNEALINDKWYKAGDKIGDAKITAVEATQIKVKWDGKETTIAPIASAVKYATVEKPEKKEEPLAGNKEAKKQKPEEAAPVEAAVEVAADDPFAWVGVAMSPELRAIFLEKWNEMSDEQKEQAKNQWNQMSDEQKQQTVNQMEMYKDQM